MKNDVKITPEQIVGSLRYNGFASAVAYIEALQEAVAMADNRLESALLGNGDACRHCVELARSYLGMVKPEKG